MSDSSGSRGQFSDSDIEKDQAGGRNGKISIYNVFLRRSLQGTGQPSPRAIDNKWNFSNGKVKEMRKQIEQEERREAAERAAEARAAARAARRAARREERARRRELAPWAAESDGSESSSSGGGGSSRRRRRQTGASLATSSGVGGGGGGGEEEGTRGGVVRASVAVDDKRNAAAVALRDKVFQSKLGYSLTKLSPEERKELSANLTNHQKLLMFQGGLEPEYLDASKSSSRRAQKAAKRTHAAARRRREVGKRLRTAGQELLKRQLSSGKIAAEEAPKKGPGMVAPRSINGYKASFWGAGHWSCVLCDLPLFSQGDRLAARRGEAPRLRFRCPADPDHALLRRHPEAVRRGREARRQRRRSSEVQVNLKKNKHTVEERYMGIECARCDSLVGQTDRLGNGALIFVLNISATRFHPARPAERRRAAVRAYLYHHHGGDHCVVA